MAHEHVVAPVAVEIADTGEPPARIAGQACAAARSTNGISPVHGVVVPAPGGVAHEHVVASVAVEIADAGEPPARIAVQTSAAARSTNGISPVHGVVVPAPGGVAHEHVVAPVAVEVPEPGDRWCWWWWRTRELDPQRVVSRPDASKAPHLDVMDPRLHVFGNPEVAASGVVVLGDPSLSLEQSPVGIGGSRGLYPQLSGPRHAEAKVIQVPGALQASSRGRRNRYPRCVGKGVAVVIRRLIKSEHSDGRWQIWQWTDISSTWTSLRLSGGCKQTSHPRRTQRGPSCRLDNPLYDSNCASDDRRGARRSVKTMRVTLSDVAGIEKMSVTGRGDPMAPSLKVDTTAIARKLESTAIPAGAGSYNDRTRITRVSVELIPAAGAVEIDLPVTSGFDNRNSFGGSGRYRVVCGLPPFDWTEPSLRFASRTNLVANTCLIFEKDNVSR